MPNVFISYRREDSKGIAGRIRDRLAKAFGERSIFMDVDSIPLGADFAGHIGTTLTRTQLLLVVIGPRWLMGPRLHDEQDFIRIEIEGAISNKVAIWPLLVEGAVMPAKSELPTSIQSISDLQAFAIASGSDFHPQIERVIRNIRRQFGGRMGGAAKGYLALFALMALLLASLYVIHNFSRQGGDVAYRSCAEENVLRTANVVTESVIVTFRNIGDSAAKLYWLNDDGKRVLYATIRSGNTALQQTFENHPWVITGLDDQCRFVYVAHANQNIVDFKSP